MITSHDFDKLFDKLVANPWEFFPEKDRIQKTRGMFYDSLKDYNLEQVNAVFNNILNDSNRRYMPTIQLIKTKIEAGISEKVWSKPCKPHTSKDKRLQRLFKRMVRQAKHIIEQYKAGTLYIEDECTNYRGLQHHLLVCGEKYESMRKKIQRMEV